MGDRIASAPRIERIARVCHEVNRAYCATIGDETQPTWDMAPEWQKQSARDGVRGVLDGSITTPSQSHDSWLSAKEADGWKYGPVKDAEKKEHPCCVPYCDLPSEQKAKDAIFCAIVMHLGDRVRCGG